MQCITLIVLAVGCLMASATVRQLPPPPNQLAPVAPPSPNFALQLKSIIRTIPRKRVQHLVRAYLLNDAEFQALIREINSLPTYRLQQQLLSQPALRQLLNWLSQQLTLAGSSMKIFEDLELEIKIFNKYPYWSQTVNGVNGFGNEFVLIYPLELIRSLLESSAQESAVFGEFWRRVVALKPMYEQFLATPGATAFAQRLQARGVNVSVLDAFVRYQFGWSNATISDYDYNDYLGGG